MYMCWNNLTNSGDKRPMMSILLSQQQRELIQHLHQEIHIYTTAVIH